MRLNVGQWFRFQTLLRPKEFIVIRFLHRKDYRIKSMARGAPPNDPKSTGWENIALERAGFGIPGKAAVGSPAATTIENNEKIRLRERAENGLL